MSLRNASQDEVLLLTNAFREKQGEAPLKMNEAELPHLKYLSFCFLFQ